MNRRFHLLVLAAAVMSAHDAIADGDTRINLRVAKGRLVDGPKVVRLKRNASVVLTVVADTADELHVHGYNFRLKLLPDQPVTFRFVAKHTGRFTFELHKVDAELGAFEIYPE